MIKVHHLNNSRSQRILWMLEELGADYEIIKYFRDKETNLAPDALREVHPLGKSPVMEDKGVKIAESGAILEYLADTYGNGKLKPEAGTPQALQYTEWMHYAEGSAMLPLLLALYVGRLGKAADPLWPRIFGEITNNLTYMNGALANQPYFAGSEFTACDVQITFALEAASANNALADFPNLSDYLARMQARPAYKKAIETGGEYSLGS
ncbi:MAG: glutathione S-transferase family protein [Parvibaculaceae bacterium]|nr:glutathione S-transferase family protein [Parvibaculaceae bacterium]